VTVARKRERKNRRPNYIRKKKALRRRNSAFGQEQWEEKKNKGLSATRDEVFASYGERKKELLTAECFSIGSGASVGPWGGTTASREAAVHLKLK